MEILPNCKKKNLQGNKNQGTTTTTKRFLISPCSSFQFPFKSMLIIKGQSLKKLFMPSVIIQVKDDSDLVLGGSDGYYCDNISLQVTANCHQKEEG